MKHFIKLVGIILSLAICVTVPVSAEIEGNSRASNYFHMTSTYIYQLNDTQFEVWFDVSAVGSMQELGSSKITVQRSADGENWVNMFTYRSEYYSQMIDYNTIEHGACVPYHGTEGYYYRAFVTFYAKNSTGSGELYRYTQTVQL